MTICHYLDLEEWTRDKDLFEGGILNAALNQRKAMENAGIDYVTSPREDYDILHINFIAPFSLYYALRARMKGKKLVVTAHTIEENFEDTFRFSNMLAPFVGGLLRYIYTCADLVICVSPYVERELNRRGINHTAVISNGIDDERLEGFEEFEDEEYIDSSDETIYFSIGDTVLRKGIDDFRRVAERKPDAEFKWFGKIINTRFAKNGTKRILEGTPENLEFTGFVSDVRECFAVGDIYLCPTLNETQGLTPFEAAYCGKPIILRDIPAFEKDFIHGHNCLKADSVDGFIEQMERLEDDEELRNRIAENARELSEDHSLGKIGQQLKKQYQNLLLETDDKSSEIRAPQRTRR